MTSFARIATRIVIGIGIALTTLLAVAGAVLVLVEGVYAAVLRHRDDEAARVLDE